MLTLPDNMQPGGYLEALNVWLSKLVGAAQLQQSSMRLLQT